jgi:hypothetical protein
LNAEIAGKLVSKFIEKRWPQDKEDVYEILKLGMNKAWQEGKWLGMTSEFTVPIHIDSRGQSYIMAPASHPILLAINSLSNSSSIRDKYFMFHKNGYGDVRDTATCKWNTDVYDLGEVPYFDPGNVDFSKGVLVGVRSLGPIGDGEKVLISGRYKDGASVYTYKDNEYGLPSGCSCETTAVDTVNGVEIEVTDGFNYINNVKFSDITSITKTKTRSPIEIVVIDWNNTGFQIGRLEPNQRFSKYRKYLVPEQMCSMKTLHCLFKISQQEDLVNPTDSLIISNEEALISLCKGIFFFYYKEQQDVGMSFISQGISVLEKEKREEESPSQSPIQVDVSSYEDLPNALRYYA